MNKQLTIHNASVSSATVKIETLTISGKQVTLAVFRQLLVDALVAEDGTLNGTPWGVVNYHPDKCADTGTHLHVVWQDGEDLRRSLERPLRGSYWSDEIDLYVKACYCENGHRLHNWMKPGKDPEDGSRIVRFYIDDLLCFADMPGSRSFTPGAYLTEHECATPDVLSFKADIAQEQERRERHRRRWAELNALPQLFIAV